MQRKLQQSPFYKGSAAAAAAAAAKSLQSMDWSLSVSVVHPHDPLADWEVATHLTAAAQSEKRSYCV